MRIIRFIPFVLLAIFSCEEGGAPVKDRLAFGKSQMKWSEFKSKNGNSYVYETINMSFTGYGSSTEITVTNDVVTGRAMESFQYDENHERTVLLSYEEVDEEVGTHDFGAPALTIDQLYQKCGTEYLNVSREDNEVYFDTDEYGIMSTCGYWPKGCMDDCFLGIRINAIDPN